MFMPIRLSWNLPAPCLEVIQTSLRQAQAIADDVDLHLEVFIRPAPPPPYLSFTHSQCIPLLYLVNVEVLSRKVIGMHKWKYYGAEHMCQV